ncbi:hypothetical protein KKC00_00430 [Patescibacteria group bacterium]|nr:hypothetical protein [Patescibacteria group bacterium]
MPKTINPITLAILLAVLIFIPVAKAEAALTYVGIKIDSAIKISDISQPSFCLKPGTKMYVMDGAAVLDTVTITGDNGVDTGICPDDGDEDMAEHQIWSNLVDLASGSAYSIKLEVPLCWGYWQKNSGADKSYRCWYAGTQTGSLAGGDVGIGESCDQVCMDHDTTFITTSIERWDEDCTALKTLTGNSCDGAYEYPCDMYGPGIYMSRYNQCYCCRDRENPTSCSDCGDDYGSGDVRLCPCNYQTGTYSFPFTFTAS